MFLFHFSFCMVSFGRTAGVSWRGFVTLFALLLDFLTPVGGFGGRIGGMFGGRVFFFV